MSDQSLELLIRKLSRLGPLGAAEREAILALPHRRETVPARHTLVREGDVPRECCVLVDGYACRHKSTSHGGRQIVSFHLPGDILDVQHLLLKQADHNVESITAATVAWIPPPEVMAVLRTYPAINDALWRDALVDASIFREWVLNVGRRNAPARVAHLLYEFAIRREAAGLGAPEHFKLPMTQVDIADATGLTVVHVNRTLRSLCEAGVICRSGRAVSISNWNLMREVADFDPAYLHQAA